MPRLRWQDLVWRIRAPGAEAGCAAGQLKKWARSVRICIILQEPDDHHRDGRLRGSDRFVFPRVCRTYPPSILIRGTRPMPPKTFLLSLALWIFPVGFAQAQEPIDRAMIARIAE